MPYAHWHNCTPTSLLLSWIFLLTSSSFCCPCTSSFEKKEARSRRKKRGIPELSALGKEEERVGGIAFCQPNPNLQLNLEACLPHLHHGFGAEYGATGTWNCTSKIAVSPGSPCRIAVQPKLKRAVRVCLIAEVGPTPLPGLVHPWTHFRPPQSTPSNLPC